MTEQLGVDHVLDNRATTLDVGSKIVFGKHTGRPIERRNDDAVKDRRILNGQRVTLSSDRRGDEFTVGGRFRPVTLALTFSHGASGPVTAVCPVANGTHPGVNVTQKSTCLSVTGTVDREGRTHIFEDADGMLDYTHGVLARETRRQWGIGTGTTADETPVGCNIVSGFNDGLENAVWVGDDRRAVGDASFTFDSQRSGTAWEVETADGILDLELTPEAVRAED